MKTKLILTFIALSHTILGQIKKPDGKKDIFTIPSKIYNTEREIAVFLPSNYEDFKDEKLPVVYVFDAQWAEFYNYVTSSISYLSSIGEFKKFIIVGIYNEDRRKEFLPQPVSTGTIKAWKAKPEFGFSNLLDEHLEKEIFPFIENNYNIEKFRIGIGHSLGGTYILNSFGENKKLFNAFIAFSPNLKYDNSSIITKIENRLNSENNINAYFNISVGDIGSTEKSFNPDIKKLESVFQSQKVSGTIYRFNYLENETHLTSPFKEMPVALTEFAKQIYMLSENELQTMLQNTKSSYSVELKEKYKNLSNWLGYEYKPTAEDINSMAYFAMKNNDCKQATTVINWAIEMYPKQIELYDSKAEFLNCEKSSNQALTALRLGQKKLEEIKNELDNETFEYYQKMLEDHIEKIQKNTP